ncbi:MAG: hypothetical protein FWC59_02925, partial [Actinomycetia bacterium]|nr:hypothetical protein [Actinomycetes bacterium]
MLKLRNTTCPPAAMERNSRPTAGQRWRRPVLALICASVLLLPTLLFAADDPLANAAAEPLTSVLGNGETAAGTNAGSNLTSIELPPTADSAATAQDEASTADAADARLNIASDQPPATVSPADAAAADPVGPADPTSPLAPDSGGLLTPLVGNDPNLSSSTSGPVVEDSPDHTPLDCYTVRPPALPPFSPAMARLAASTEPPASIVVRVTLYPPAYAAWPDTPSQVGFHGAQWLDISQNGFYAAYNSVQIIQGYDGQDWLYGVTGDTEQNAVFAPNSTVHCIDPGYTAPCPGADNTRDITMNHVGETDYQGQFYDLYWGAAVFNYDLTHAYGPGPQRMGTFVAIPRYGSITVQKVDQSTGDPVADTQFELLSWPVQVVAGLLASDISAVTAESLGWQLVASGRTDADGLIHFERRPYGYYQIRESCPNPRYQSAAESGLLPVLVIMDKYNTSPLQLVSDALIQVGVEVLKDTINQTSAAFCTSADDYLQLDNTGVETFHYDLYFRSTSNVRVDEFTVIDPLENVAADQVRLSRVFTPVVWGDSDGCYNLWYQTNHTDSARSYSGLSALSTNPDNPLNPQNQAVWPNTGWQLWQAEIPAQISLALDVADLGLAADEYLTGLRFEFGSVEVGFTNWNSPLATLQASKEFHDLNPDWTPRPTDRFFADGALAASGLQPATYLVYCPSALLPPTTIRNSVTALLARNLVLTASDYDEVWTSVIQPFLLLRPTYAPLAFS